MRTYICVQVMATQDDDDDDDDDEDNDDDRFARLCHSRSQNLAVALLWLLWWLWLCCGGYCGGCGCYSCGCCGGGGCGGGCCLQKSQPIPAAVAHSITNDDDFIRSIDPNLTSFGDIEKVPPAAATRPSLCSICLAALCSYLPPLRPLYYPPLSLCFPYISLHYYLPLSLCLHSIAAAIDRDSGSSARLICCCSKVFE